MFVFCNPCVRAELHQQKRARKLCSATLKLVTSGVVGGRWGEGWYERWGERRKLKKILKRLRKTESKYCVTLSVKRATKMKYVEQIRNFQLELVLNKETRN